MRLVNPIKLALLRDVIDECVVELAIGGQFARRDALVRCAIDLGYKLEFFKIDDWYLATCQPNKALFEIALFGEHVDFEHAAAVDLQSRSNHAFATTPEVAAIAVLLCAIDERADVFFTEDEAAEVYPEQLIEDMWIRLSGFEDYILQERWFGDVPQRGRASIAFGILSSDDGLEWYDVEQEYAHPTED